MLVSVWFADWLILHAAEKQLKPRTVESYKDLIDRYVVPLIGSIEIGALSPLDIRHMLAAVIAQGKGRTAELLYTMLKCAFSELDSNPMLKVKRPKHVQKSPDPWNDAEMAIYTDALQNHKHGLALSLAIILGLRRGEICGLRWKDIDFEAQELHVVNQRVTLANGETIDCSPKSAASDRRIPLPPLLLSVLQARRGLPECYLCSLSPSGLDQAHRALVERLGLRYIPLHGLRHSMATSCIRHGGQMRGLQSILGHSTYAVTANKYTHVDHSILLSAVDAAAKPCYTVLQ